MSRRQFTHPMLVQDGRVVPLHHVSYDDRKLDEGYLQRILFEHPELLPAHEVEPLFTELIPVARELPTAAGPIDLVYVTPQGYLVLVETKLWRNPDARRSVVAQIIDYTKDMARWSYGDLVKAVKFIRHDLGDDPLIELVREAADDEIDDVTFHDQVSRNLRLGRFLLLIVGDGIREDVEHMAEFLQQTPHLHFTLALVEIGLYRIGETRMDSLFVQPRIIARTKEVTRAIVEIRNRLSETAEVVVTLPEEDERISSTRSIMTEDAFFEELAQKGSPTSVEFAKWVLREAPKHELQTEWGSGGPLLKYTEPTTGHTFTMCQLYRNGVLSEFHRFYRRCRKLKLPEDVWTGYLDDIAALVPGAARRSFTTKNGNCYYDVAKGPEPYNDAIRLDEVADKRSEWFEVIDRSIARIGRAIEGESVG